MSHDQIVRLERSGEVNKVKKEGGKGVSYILPYLINQNNIGCNRPLPLYAQNFCNVSTKQLPI